MSGQLSPNAPVPCVGTATAIKGLKVWARAGEEIVANASKVASASAPGKKFLFAACGKVKTRFVTGVDSDFMASHPFELRQILMLVRFTLRGGVKNGANLKSEGALVQQFAH
jgi:hypothetical protein